MMCITNGLYKSFITAYCTPIFVIYSMYMRWIKKEFNASAKNSYQKLVES